MRNSLIHGIINKSGRIVGGTIAHMQNALECVGMLGHGQSIDFKNNYEKAVDVDFHTGPRHATRALAPSLHDAQPVTMDKPQNKKGGLSQTFRDGMQQKYDEVRKKAPARSAKLNFSPGGA